MFRGYSKFQLGMVVLSGLLIVGAIVFFVLLATGVVGITEGGTWSRVPRPKPIGPVSVKLSGGLGNQLFQTAAAYAYGQRHGKKFILDKSMAFAGGSSDDVKRPTYWQSVFKWVNPLDGSMKSVQRHVESDFHYVEIPFEHKGLTLEGYFQSDKYFADFAKEFKVLIRLSAPALTVGLPVSELPLVSMHIRRGDYLLDKNSIHVVQSIEYYQEAVEAVEAKVGGPVAICVFSDDHEWSQRELPGRFPDHKMYFAMGATDVEDMLLMSNCDHHVIANSSFSWWGAYLDVKKVGGVVVAPKRWFDDDGVRDTKDLYCEGWISV